MVWVQVLVSTVEVNLSQLSVKYGIKCLQSTPFCIKIVKIFRRGAMPPDPLSRPLIVVLNVVPLTQLNTPLILAPPPTSKIRQ